MDTFITLLKQHIVQVETISRQIEDDKPYLDDVKAYLPLLTDMVTKILGLTQDQEIGLDLDEQFLLQVLNDIVYGIEQEDSVFLFDVLRYGLLEVYYYIGSELQGGE